MRQARSRATLDGHVVPRSQVSAVLPLTLGADLALTFVTDPHSIVTSFRYKSTWPTVIRLLNDKVFGDATQLITHTFKLEESRQAFETCVTASERSIKVQIVDEE